MDQRLLVIVKEKGHNTMVAKGESHSIIQFEGVSLGYGNGRRILIDMTFVLNPGSFHFLGRPSGAGKTSRLRSMDLPVRPTRGVVTLPGRDISSLRRPQRAGLRRKVGVVFQDVRRLARLSVFDNVALPPKIIATHNQETIEPSGQPRFWLERGVLRSICRWQRPGWEGGLRGAFAVTAGA